MSKLVLLGALLIDACTGLQVGSPAARGMTSCAHRGPASGPQMKGKGTRGLPGNRGGFSAGGGMTKEAKQRFEKADFEKSEWTLVAEKGLLGNETGSTLAVEAGQTPQGQNYIWTLVRGVPLTEDGPETTVYATDGSARCCLFPMTKATAEADGDGFTLTCGLCGTKYSLDEGEVLDWMPKSNPVQWAAAAANSNKEPIPCTVLKTRVSQAGRTYLRLPDGTLPITTQRVEGTINERVEIAPKSEKSAKKSTSKKARKAAKA